MQRGRGPACGGMGQWTGQGRMEAAEASQTKRNYTDSDGWI